MGSWLILRTVILRRGFLESFDTGITTYTLRENAAAAPRGVVGVVRFVLDF